MYQQRIASPADGPYALYIYFCDKAWDMGRGIVWHGLACAFSWNHGLWMVGRMGIAIASLLWVFFKAALSLLSLFGLRLALLRQLRVCEWFFCLMG